MTAFLIFIADKSSEYYQGIIKCLVLKNADHNFPQHKTTSSNRFFCPANSPKPKDPSVTILNEKKKQQIHTFTNLKPTNVWHVCLGKWLRWLLIIKRIESWCKNWSFLLIKNVYNSTVCQSYHGMIFPPHRQPQLFTSVAERDRQVYTVCGAQWASVLSTLIDWPPLCFFVAPIWALHGPYQ